MEEDIKVHEDVQDKTNDKNSSITKGEDDIYDEENRNKPKGLESSIRR